MGRKNVFWNEMKIENGNMEKDFEETNRNGPKKSMCSERTWKLENSYRYSVAITPKETYPLLQTERQTQIFHFMTKNGVYEFVKINSDVFQTSRNGLY